MQSRIEKKCIPALKKCMPTHKKMYTHPKKMYTHPTTSRDLAAPCLCAFHSAISIETVMANTQKLGPHRPRLALNETLQKNKANVLEWVKQSWKRNVSDKWCFDQESVFCLLTNAKACGRDCTWVPPPASVRAKNEPLFSFPQLCF